MFNWYLFILDNSKYAVLLKLELPIVKLFKKGRSTCNVYTILFTNNRDIFGEIECLFTNYNTT